MYEELREHESIEYRMCEHDSHYWKRDKEMYESKKYGAQMSLKSNLKMSLGTNWEKHIFLLTHPHLLLTHYPLC